MSRARNKAIGYVRLLTTLFNQADCREKTGQLATAWGLFVDAERQTRAAADDVGMRLHKVALERASKLEPRLSRITIHVAQHIDGLVIVRDDEPVDAGEWNRELPIDGGTYTFRGRIGQREVWSETLTIGAQSDRRAIDVVIRRPAEAPVIPRIDLAPHPEVRVEMVPHATSRSYVAPAVATVGAALLLGGALGFELWGDQQYSDAQAANDMVLWTSANHKRYAAEGFLVAGAACSTLAIWLWVRGDGSESPARVTSRRTTVAPVAGAGFAGLQLDGRW